MTSLAAPPKTHATKAGGWASFFPIDPKRAREWLRLEEEKRSDKNADDEPIFCGRQQTNAEMPTQRNVKTTKYKLRSHAFAEQV